MDQCPPILSVAVDTVVTSFGDSIRCTELLQTVSAFLHSRSLDADSRHQPSNRTIGLREGHTLGLGGKRSLTSRSIEVNRVELPVSLAVVCLFADKHLLTRPSGL